MLECLPRDNVDYGIINHGYISDQVHDNETKLRYSSLTVALRINRPELIFIVETTSNKKRYFVTKTEILLDYSRHGKRINLVVSLSGLHSLFYELGLNAKEPYVILKQCDIELSKSITEDRREKITASVSSIFVQLCNRVVHSINDIFNDIIEHFKVPDYERHMIDIKKSCSKNFELEDLWEPKKVNDTTVKSEEPYCDPKPTFIQETFLLQKSDFTLVLELEECPVLILKSHFEATFFNWSTLLNSTCEFTIQANYFNENMQVWEPLVDPVVLDENDYKPWEVNIKIFQDKALPMLKGAENIVKKDKSRRHSGSKTSTDDEEDSGEGMMYLEPTVSLHNQNNRRIKTSLSTFLDDSDSENEENAMEKLAAAISDLFTG